jgi:hypothetical protein
MRPSRIATAALTVAFALSLISVSAASATTTISLSGTVACENGGKVNGVWVQSSAGGSNWATYTRRTDASWIADYKFSWSISATASTVELHVGCGGSTATWGSSNKYKLGSISGTKKASFRCNDVTGTNGYRCQSWPLNTVLVGMPFTGVFGAAAGQGSPANHETVGYDVAVDLYATSDVKVFVYAQRDISLTLDPEYFKTGTCGYVNVGVKLDGKKVGQILYGHLDSYSAQVTTHKNLTLGSVIGKTKNWGYDASCYQVTTSSGVHTHVAFTSVNAWACMGPQSALGKSRSTGQWIGIVGDGGKAARAVCGA